MTRFLHSFRNHDINVWQWGEGILRLKTRNEIAHLNADDATELRDFLTEWINEHDAK